MIIEICANSFESAKAAQDGGADRIELCENLSVGGITPRKELIESVISELEIPVHVLIRPRGGDFVYFESELDEMLADIFFSKQIGCAGIVSGVLTSEGDINIIATERLIKASEGMQFTFHRAFDECRNPLQALEHLKQMKIARLLSSGQRSTAIEGIALLKELKKLSEEKIEIMPGSGINSENALKFKEAGFDSIHFSAIKKQLDSNATDLFKSSIVGHSNQKEIEKVIQLLS